MVAPTAGEIVVIPFPFSDLTQSKVRLALCLAVSGRGDYVLCQITNQPYGDPLALKIDDQDFTSGDLHVESFVRPAKLFTADANLFLSTEGKLSSAACQRSAQYGCESAACWTFVRQRFAVAMVWSAERAARLSYGGWTWDRRM